jgi:hypothetical protein
LTAALEPSFLYDWNQTVPGVENTSACTIAYDDPFNAAFTAAIPVAGLNFRWTPPTCPPPAWPVDITEIRFDRATVGWSFPPTAEGFEYVIATIDDPSDPNAVVSGNTEEVGILVEGLQPLTNYFVFVRSQCGGNPDRGATELGSAPTAELFSSAVNLRWKSSIALARTARWSGVTILRTAFPRCGSVSSRDMWALRVANT